MYKENKHPQQPISVVSDTRFSGEAETLPHFSVCGDQAESGNVLPLLFEIRHAIARWLQIGESTVIDIRRVPLSQKEEQDFEAALGRGEVTAELQILGKTEVIETQLPGVWLITHFNCENEVMSKTVEVIDVPAIFSVEKIDVERGLQAIDHFLAEQTH